MISALLRTLDEVPWALKRSVVPLNPLLSVIPVEAALVVALKEGVLIVPKL